ncbi:hypothetical protein LTR37_018092 [Vermiconidia calcicola]|uniref:Uncharacterized protein n=1 Tax=Vermiconidia calcicola TaxID=1690605 RepID=A0ACC3MJQ2_9PEZI|nr:hypothetical protein LTR37_018092 [Vermiconidia calcicola]
MSGPKPISESAAAKEVPHAIVSLSQHVIERMKQNRGVPNSTGMVACSAHQDLQQPTVEYERAVSAAPQTTLLAQGGYNDVWLVKSKLVRNDSTIISQPLNGSFILRVPNEDSLKPHQIRNEVGWLMYMAKHCPEIPVPAVYDYSDESGDGRPFIAEQYIDAKSLADAWMTFSDAEKDIVARKVAEMVVRLGEIRFDAIGGMTPHTILGPTVEGAKLFKGRDAYHDPICYDIGPYASIKQYILAYFDKEIYYYSHADETMLDQDLFEETTPNEFAQALKKKRACVEAELDASPRAEPFVLCHNDLQGRNILMRGTEIAAVIDWEFAGSFPLSELNSDGMEVLEMVDDETEEECMQWSSKISELVEQVARERGWEESDIEPLASGGDSTLQSVRVEMMPEVED